MTKRKAISLHYSPLYFKGSEFRKVKKQAVREGILDLKKWFTSHFDVGYAVKFVLYFVPLYYFHIIYLGLTDPNNVYVPFLDHHLNYIAWFEASILNASNFILHSFGVNSVVEGQRIIIKGGAYVLFWPACAGLGISSFWIAFIIAHCVTWKKKLYWCAAGIFCIWLINSARIAIYLVSLQNGWKTFKHIDHHDMFTLISYIIIVFLIFLFNKSLQKQDSLQV